MNTILSRAKAPGPKRILSLDGGGIRGCLSIGYLKEIEKLLRIQSGNDRLVLADYFDLIGGTSTGALIAAQLALGFEVAKVRENYKSLGPRVFSKSELWARVPFIGKKLFTRWSVKPIRSKISSYLSRTE